MQAVHAIDMRVFHRTGEHHRQRAAVGFLRRLEEQLHAAMQPVAHTAEHFRRAQQDCRVRVMAAGVHHPRMFRAERTAFRLVERQCVHIRAQRHNAAGQFALDQSDDPRAFRRVRNTQLVKRLHDYLLRLEFRKTALRNPVQPAAHVDDPILFLKHKRLDFLVAHAHNQHLFLISIERFRNAHNAAVLDVHARHAPARAGKGFVSVEIRPCGVFVHAD